LDLRASRLRIEKEREKERTGIGCGERSRKRCKGDNDIKVILLNRDWRKPQNTQLIWKKKEEKTRTGEKTIGGGGKEEVCRGEGNHLLRKPFFTSLLTEEVHSNSAEATLLGVRETSLEGRGTAKEG